MNTSSSWILTPVMWALAPYSPNDKKRAHAYGSRTLSHPEHRYCITRRELLAVVTFIQHFRPYLFGREFLLHTDHGSLTWLTSFKEPEGQLAQWLECLQEFSFEIVHRSGRKHTNADALSRRPCSQCGREDSSHQKTTTFMKQLQHFLISAPLRTCTNFS